MCSVVTKLKTAMMTYTLSEIHNLSSICANLQPLTGFAWHMASVMKLLPYNAKVAHDPELPAGWQHV